MVQVYPYRSRRNFRSEGRAGGVNDEQTWSVRTEAVGKSQWNESPYLLANEWISANLAQFLRLPVPPFAIAGKKSPKTRMFISYSYDGDTKPDDVDPEVFYQRFPFESTGIVMFDVLVANCDRHGGNLKVDNPSKPKAFYLIDHERALFYIYEKEGLKRLNSRVDRLGIADGQQSDDEWHCLVELIDNVDHIETWLDRIQSIPDWFIDDICNDVWKMPITKPECDGVKAFLKGRRDNFHKLILDHKDRFLNVKDWPLFIGARS